MQLEALSLLIDDRLVQQFLRKNGPPVSPVEVNKKLAELESGFEMDLLNRRLHFDYTY